MASCFNPGAPRKAVNLSLNSDLLRISRELDLNISAVAEAALAQAVQACLSEKWLADNAEAICGYNARIEAQGVFSDGLRTF